MEAVQAVKRGRPPVENKAQFRNVAVPIDAYNLLRSAKRGRGADNSTAVGGAYPKGIWQNVTR